MEICFIGVGEACDAHRGNTSILVKGKNGANLLCDCGFSVPHAYFSFVDDPDQLDGVWISHFHGDHFFGIPLLLLRLWEMRRSRPLIIASQPGAREKVLGAMDLAFPGFGKKLCYELRFKEIEPGVKEDIAGLSVQAVQTDHSQRNLGLLVDDDRNRLYYSGDGRATGEVASLIQGCDLAVHEAFKLDEEIHHHGSIAGCIELVETASIKKLALVHLERSCRLQQINEIEALLASHSFLTLPESGDRIIL